MTNNRLFTFLMISLIGGFVLSTPCSALAATLNEETLANEKISDEIKGFLASEMVKSDTQVTPSSLVTSLAAEIGDKNSGLVAKMNDALGKLEQKYKCKEESGWLEKILPGNDEQVLHTILGKSYSWVFHVEERLANCDKIPAEERNAVIEIAKSIEDKRQQYQRLRKLEGSDSQTYIWCPSPDETSCAITEEDTKRKITFEKKCCIPFQVNEEDGTISSIAGTSVGCVPLAFKLYEAKSCLFCPLFDVIFKAVQNAATVAFDTMSKPLSTLVLIGLSIWIAFMVLANVSSMTKQDAPKFLNDLFKASFKVIIAFLLLRNSSIIYGIIIGPLLKAGFEFGVSFLNYADGSFLSSCSSNKDLIGAGGSGGVLPNYVYANLLCFIKAIQYELATSQAIGSSLMCVSVNAGLSNINAVAKVMPDFTMMMQGALIYIISFILSLAFGFYLIDATISLGIFGVLLPFLLLCWPFKPTNGYFKKGVEVFMNSWFIYVFMGIVVNITMQLIGKGLTGGKGGFDEIMRAINANEVKTLQSLLDIGFAGFLILVACCIFGVKLMMKVESLAGQFAGGGLGLGIGAKVGGLAASTATAGTTAAVGAV